jgi:hypothetical protein
MNAGQKEQGSFQKSHPTQPGTYQRDYVPRTGEGAHSGANDSKQVPCHFWWLAKVLPRIN